MLPLRAALLGADRPTLDLNFAALRQLDPRVTFSRASGGASTTATGGLETVGTNVPRFPYDPVTGQSLGFLPEEGRTNLLLNSAALATQNVTVAAVAHTLSFTGTGTVTLSGASTAGPLVGTGAGEANRVRLTFTPTAGTLTVTVSGAVNDAQLEAGTLASSYISTTGASALRAADVATMTGANFSQWYRQDQGTFIVDWAQTYPFASASSPSPRLFEVNDGTASSGWLAYVATATGQVSFQRENGLPIISFGAVASLNRAAFAYGNGMIYGSLNGGPVVSAASTLPGTLNRLDIGDRFDGLRKRNGPIARLRFLPRVMPAQLQRLSTL